MRVPFRLLAILHSLMVQAAVASGASLVLDHERSVVEVEVHDTFGTFTGRLQRFEAAVDIDPAGPTVQRAEVDFKFADLRTGRARRDLDMLEWENEAEYPAVRFHLEGQITARGGPVRVRGRLAMHGVERGVYFPVSFLVEGPVCSVDGVVELDYRDYGLPLIRKYLLLTVDPRLRVRFHLQGRLVETAPVP
jgi:polyisoprenoid-binding protein YceI